MPLSESGKSVLRKMQARYGSSKGKRVFYASERKGIKGSSSWTRRKNRVTGR